MFGGAAVSFSRYSVASVLIAGALLKLRHGLAADALLSVGAQFVVLSVEIALAAALLCTQARWVFRATLVFAFAALLVAVAYYTGSTKASACGCFGEGIHLDRVAHLFLLGTFLLLAGVMNLSGSPPVERRCDPPPC